MNWRSFSGILRKRNASWRGRRAALLVAVVGAASAAPAGARAQTAPPSREEAVRQLLAQRDDALKRGDRAAFLDTVDPAATEEFKVRQGHLFDGLRSLPLASYSLELRTDEAPDLGAGLAAKYPSAEEVFVPPVEARYRLTGVDTVDAVDGYYFTFLLREGRWRIVSDRDLEDVGLPSARNLWDYGPVNHQRTEHFTILHDPADRKRAEALAPLCEQGYSRLTSAAFGRALPAQIVVVLPHSLDQLREILQATFDLSNFVAFASASVDRDQDWQSTAPRVYVQDTNLSRSRRDFQLQTFHHEFVHVAAFPLAGPFVPSWIHEGLADWMATGEENPEDVEGSDGVLPEDWEFTTGGSEGIIRAYDESTSAMAYLAAEKGRTAPLDLLVRVGEQRAAPGTSRYRVDQALRAVYGAGLDQFEKDWNGGR